MAVDSQQKRMSAAGHGRLWMRGVFPVATPTEAWRLNVGAAYAGNALSPISASPFPTGARHIGPVIHEFFN